MLDGRKDKIFLGMQHHNAMILTNTYINLAYTPYGPLPIALLTSLLRASNLQAVD
jgi:hypothetical protein